MSKRKQNSKSSKDKIKTLENALIMLESRKDSEQLLALVFITRLQSLEYPHDFKKLLERFRVLFHSKNIKIVEKSLVLGYILQGVHDLEVLEEFQKFHETDKVKLENKEILVSILNIISKMDVCLIGKSLKILYMTTKFKDDLIIKKLFFIFKKYLENYEYIDEFLQFDFLEFIFSTSYSEERNK